MAPFKPRYRGAGVVKAHCNVFGPAAEFPVARERKYTTYDVGKQEVVARAIRDR